MKILRLRERDHQLLVDDVASARRPASPAGARLASLEHASRDRDATRDRDRDAIAERPRAALPTSSSWLSSTCRAQRALAVAVEAVGEDVVDARARIAGVLARDRSDQRIGRARRPARRAPAAASTATCGAAARAATAPAPRPPRRACSPPAIAHGTQRRARAARDRRRPRRSCLRRAAADRSPGAARPRRSSRCLSRRELDVAARRADHRRDLEQRAIVGRHRRRRAARERLVDELGERLRVRALAPPSARPRARARGRSGCRRHRFAIRVSSWSGLGALAELLAERAHRAEQQDVERADRDAEPLRALLARQLLDQAQLDRGAIALLRCCPWSSSMRARWARALLVGDQLRVGVASRDRSRPATSCTIASASRRERFDWRWTSKTLLIAIWRSHG